MKSNRKLALTYNNRTKIFIQHFKIAQKIQNSISRQQQKVHSFTSCHVTDANTQAVLFKSGVSSRPSFGYEYECYAEFLG